MRSLGILIVLFGLIGSPLLVSGQKSIKDSTISLVAIGGHVGLQLPFADLAQRFDYGGITGASFIYKGRNNLFIHGNFGVFFGNQVKEDSILNSIKTDQDIIIDRTGNPASVALLQRGFLVNGRVGKIFPVVGPNPNSGILGEVGVGFMQHRIRIQDELESIPQLQGDYRKGYDRLTNGLSLVQSIGYQHFSDYRLINFYIGIEVHEGFTMNRRELNFDTGLRDRTNRLDILSSLVIRWYFPMYKRQPQDFYFY